MKDIFRQADGLTFHFYVQDDCTEEDIMQSIESIKKLRKKENSIPTDTGKDEPSEQ